MPKKCKITISNNPGKPPIATPKTDQILIGIPSPKKLIKNRIMIAATELIAREIRLFNILNNSHAEKTANTRINMPTSIESTINFFYTMINLTLCFMGIFIL